MNENSQNFSGDVLYQLFLQKAFSLVSKRRYTVLKLKRKLNDFVKRELGKIEAGKSRLSREESEALIEFKGQDSNQSYSQGQISDLEEQIKKVLTRLKELKYLDDTRFTTDYIDSQTACRPRGAYRLKRELQNKGIHPELAERLVLLAHIDEEEIAFTVLQKKLKSIERFPRQKQKEKAMRFLASRGFKLDAIYKAINRWYNKSAI